MNAIDGMPARKRRRRSLSGDVTDSSEDENGSNSSSASDAEDRRHTQRVPHVEKRTSRVRASGQENGVTAPVPASIAEAKSAASLASRTSFATLGVAPWLVASLSSMQIKRPTSIQAGCIPHILQGSDCIGGSRTGSGKTLAFAVPILHLWSKDPRGVFALVLTPTRELALQIHEQLIAIGAPQQLKSLLITGGADQTAQALALARNPHVVVATPGRLADHIRHSGEETVRGLRRAAFFVLDEADRLLEPGQGSMLPDVGVCMGILPPAAERQTCVFTATVTDEVRSLKEQPRVPQKPPLFVCELEASSRSAGNGGSQILPAKLRQSYVLAPLTHRESFLHALLTTPALASRSTIVFANRAATAQLLTHMLSLLEHRVTALHSVLPQRERTANLGRFRARAARILVATDVASRGLDIPDVELVVNFDVPRNPDDYVHRVGRTARADKPGLSITIVGQRDVELVLAIEERVGAKMDVYSEKDEEGRELNLENRVIQDALKTVGEKKREAMLQIETGRSVKGKRTAQKLRPA